MEALGAGRVRGGTVLLALMASPVPAQYSTSDNTGFVFPSKLGKQFPALNDKAISLGLEQPGEEWKLCAYEHHGKYSEPHSTRICGCANGSIIYGNSNGACICPPSPGVNSTPSVRKSGNPAGARAAGV